LVCPSAALHAVLPISMAPLSAGGRALERRCRLDRALPPSLGGAPRPAGRLPARAPDRRGAKRRRGGKGTKQRQGGPIMTQAVVRSEEHTSELHSRDQL